MTTLNRTQSFADETRAPASPRLRPGEVRPLGAYATIRLAARGAAPVAVVVAGEVDLACADEFAKLLHSALDAYPQGVDLDLAAVRFCDGRGLAALLAARAFARRHGRHFAVGPHSPVVARLFELTGARSMLTGSD